MLWAACTPTMQGIIKCHIRGQEQCQRVKCVQLEAKILELGGQTKHFDIQVVQHQLAISRSELRQVSLEEAKQWWQALTRRVYGMDDKSDKLLYWPATRGAAAKVGLAIRHREENNQVELAAIARAFATSYQDLYARDPLPHLAEEGSIVWDLPVPTILSNLVQDLDQPLTAEEVDALISELNGGKWRAGWVPNRVLQKALFIAGASSPKLLCRGTVERSISP
ncbi:hypothetical protein NDU88_001720 [Pleurodeles waltl]|uniref:Uncharacterized protein n=1 Tax=Pleurodeles waltl TaxID=8319 RepID=A0AAV7R7X8_PLEWA|nr:hypothetical protein NDU88_001720 [Pleurodeles waltl]